MSSVGAETAVSLLLGDVEATHGWAVIYVVTALACLVGSYVACCGKDGRGSGSGLRPIEHWSASGDGKPAKHRSVHHELRHNWRLLNADETIRGGKEEELERRLTGNLVGRHVWVCDGERGADEPGPTFNPQKNPNSADKIWRSRALGTGARGEPVYEEDEERGDAEAAELPAEEALMDAIGYYEQLQAVDGHFPGDYGGPLFLMPGLVIACYITGTELSAPKREAMITYLRNHNQEDGGWGLHIESPSTMFGTVMNYVAFRLLGVDADDEICVEARAFIRKHGGGHGVPSWGKFWLSCLGVYDWRGLNPIPPELWMLPYWIPFHPARLWCHCRMVYLPMSYIWGRKEECTAPLTDLTRAIREEIYATPYDEVNWDAARNYVCPLDLYAAHPPLLVVLNKLLVMYEKISSWGPFRRIKQGGVAFAGAYIDAEDSQTNFIDIGPVNKFMNLLSVFYRHGRDSDRFQNHLARIEDYLWVAEDGMKVQGYNGSQLWDTAFFGQALLESGVIDRFRRCAQGINRFVRDTQVEDDVDDRAQYFRHISRGGWPFSTADHGWPIADCTSEGLKVALGLRRLPWIKDAIPRSRCEDALNVILSLQNDDGGWATYENTRGWRWYEQLNPAEIFGDIMIDYSYVELSTACITGLVQFAAEFPDCRTEEVQRAIRRGKKFVAGVQREDGSWYGSWGVCFTYATWFGIEGLLAAGEDRKSPRVRRACEFLLSKQEADGGWGESYLSCVTRKYSHNKQEGSQVVNTAWALLGLMAAHDPDREAVERGIRFLIARQRPSGDWPQQSISGVFNRTCGITYSQYRNIFPLWALARYNGEYDVDESE